jgi:hypothetical protein
MKLLCVPPHPPQAAARGESTAGAEQEAGTSRSYAMEEQEEDERADERAYQQELAAELAGVPFSQSKQRRGQADDDDSEPDEPSDEEGPTSMPGATPALLSVSLPCKKLVASRLSPKRSVCDAIA